MLFEDLYDSVLRRYRASPPTVKQERPVPRGRLFELLDATRGVRQQPAKKTHPENVKAKDPSE